MPATMRTPPAMEPMNKLVSDVRGPLLLLAGAKVHFLLVPEASFRYNGGVAGGDRMMITATVYGMQRRRWRRAEVRRWKEDQSRGPVSYTHLDVYKRQLDAGTPAGLHAAGKYVVFDQLLGDGASAAGGIVADQALGRAGDGTDVNAVVGPETRVLDEMCIRDRRSTTRR